MPKRVSSKYWTFERNWLSWYVKHYTLRYKMLVALKRRRGWLKVRRRTWQGLLLFFQHASYCYFSTTINVLHQVDLEKVAGGGHRWHDAEPRRVQQFPWSRHEWMKKRTSTDNSSSGWEKPYNLHLLGNTVVGLGLLPGSPLWDFLRSPNSLVTQATRSPTQVCLV